MKEFVFKILILGDGGVGKTTYLERLKTGKFSFDTKMTLGADFHVHEVDLDKYRIKFNIWDIGGQEQFRFLVPTYRKGCHGAIIMYDLTRVNSIRNLPYWIEMMHEENPDIPILIVGSKSDLVVDRISHEEEVQIIADQYQAFAHMKSSSKTGEHIHDVNNKIIEKIINTNIPNISCVPLTFQ